MTHSADNASAKPVSRFPVSRIADGADESGDTGVTDNEQSASMSKGRIGRRRPLSPRVLRSVKRGLRAFSSLARRRSRVTNQISIKLRNAFRGEHAEKDAAACHFYWKVYPREIYPRRAARSMRASVRSLTR